jgi:hypothetical protein
MCSQMTLRIAPAPGINHATPMCSRAKGNSARTTSDRRMSAKPMSTSPSTMIECRSALAAPHNASTASSAARHQASLAIEPQDRQPPALSIDGGFRRGAGPGVSRMRYRRSARDAAGARRAPAEPIATATTSGSRSAAPRAALMTRHRSSRSEPRECCIDGRRATIWISTAYERPRSVRVDRYVPRGHRGRTGPTNETRRVGAVRVEHSAGRRHRVGGRHLGSAERGRPSHVPRGAADARLVPRYRRLRSRGERTLVRPGLRATRALR